MTAFTTFVEQFSDIVWNSCLLYTSDAADDIN